MKKRLLILIFFIPMLGLSHSPEKANKETAFTLTSMLKKVTPTVVNIMAERKRVLVSDNEFPLLHPKKKRQNILVTVGSGVIIDAKKGLIVTNAHVINHEKLMIVTLKDGRRYHANLLGQDNGFDIAIIHIKAKHLISIPFGDSNRLQVGNFVAAIGSPFGLKETVTYGVISALNRSEPKIEGYQSFIQTDAPINPGNSGGALLNLNGQLIGINTAIITPTYGNIGIGFAIPSNMIKSVVTQLLKYGKVESGMLGVVAQNVSPALATAMDLQANYGVLVTKVFAGSPASKAHLQVKDVILEVNHESIHHSVQLRNMLGIMRPGTPLTIVILRNHSKKVLKGQVGDPKKIMKPKEIPFLAGMSLQDFSELESDGAKIKGVLVTHVLPSSQGMLSGLIPGDVITSANSKKVNSIKELISTAKQGHLKQLLLEVTRKSSNLFLVIELS